LHVVSDAIRAGTVESLVFPDPIAADPRHRRGLYPRYGLPSDYSPGGRFTLASRDYMRWHMLHDRLHSR
jgi:hypothetical protein